MSDETIRVLVCVPPTPRGGVARSSARLVASLRAAGHEALLARPDDALFPGDVRHDERGVRFAQADAPDLQAWTDRLLEAIDARGPMVVLGYYGTTAGPCAVAAARLRGVPAVLALRGNDLDRDVFDGGRNAVLRWAVDRATRVAAVSREMQAKAAAWLGVTAALTPNGVDTDAFRPDDAGADGLRARWGLDPARPVLGVFGEVKRKRGLERLAALGRALDGWQVVVVGEVRPEARADLPPGARVVGWLDDDEALRAAYGACDLVAQPSVHDGTPNVVLEAMACGRLVAAAPVGGILDVVRHGQTGLLCADPAAWREALALARTPAAARIGAAARAAAPSLAAERDAFVAVLREALACDA
ncbi:MAG: glycosyltransferase family 4 protein [Planctomycetes bacterium]|nr:glycosyltransferase family 4 protein [Planctomycetota bacterium]